MRKKRSENMGIQKRKGESRKGTKNRRKEMKGQTEGRTKGRERRKKENERNGKQDSHF